MPNPLKTNTPQIPFELLNGAYIARRLKRDKSYVFRLLRGQRKNKKALQEIISLVNSELANLNRVA